jgi:hypothetical protein
MGSRSETERARFERAGAAACFVLVPTGFVT